MFNITAFEHNDRDHATWIQTLCAILYKSRPWHARQQDRHQLHPVIVKALALDWPTDWKRVILEWPHVSTEDAKRLAYTRDEAKGEANRTTVTAIGKYVKQHWPLLSDDVIAKMTSAYLAKGCEIRTSQRQIVQAVEEGPRSCMQWRDTDTSEHPYNAYAPELGWAVAVRLNDDGCIDGRALLWEGVIGLVPYKCFVRTYARNPDGDTYSHADEELRAWLMEQGYTHRDGWPAGARIAKVPSSEFNHGNMFPYLDGSNDTVDEDGDAYVIRCGGGRFCCDCTDGDATHNQGEMCYECDGYFDDDDMNDANRQGDDIRVCDRCLSRSYTRVLGTGSSYSDHYYVRDYCVLEIGGEQFDENNLPSWIVHCDHGGYANEDDVVYCRISNESFDSADHPDLVILGDGSYCHESYAFQCYGDNEWYLNSEVECVHIDGRDYHPDNAPKQDDDEDEDEAQIGSPNEACVEPIGASPDSHFVITTTNDAAFAAAA